MFSYISRLAGFYHLPTVESLAVRKYRHGPGSWPVTHRKTKTHTPRSKQLALRWCYFRKYLYRLATTNCGCWGAIYAGLGKSPKSKNARCISELLGDCLTKAPFWDETPAAESICIDSSIFLSVAHIYKYFKILIIPLYTYIIYIYRYNTHSPYQLQVVRNCFCTWEWGLGWGDLCVVVTRSMVSLAGSQVPWIPCSCIRPLMRHYDLFSSSSFMATTCQGWSVQVSSAKTHTFLYQAIAFRAPPIHYHRSGNVPGVRLARAKGLQSNCLLEVMWCSQWLVPLIGWNIWNILVQLDGLFCFIYPNGEVFF